LSLHRLQAAAAVLALAAGIAFAAVLVVVRAPSQASAAPPIDHVFVIVMENHAYNQIVGSTSAPYFNGLIPTGGLAASYSAVTHPSLPNYLALAGASTFGITSDCTTCWVSATNIADRIEGVGSTWKAYMESMPSACFVGDSYPYAQKHNPFIYFNNIRTNSTRCAQHIVPYSQMSTDLKSTTTTPNYAFITPNMCNDTHDCAVSSGDNWLKAQVPVILGSPAFKTQHSLLAIVWDEDDSSGSNQVPLLLLGPAASPGAKSLTSYSHYSLLHTIENGLGVTTLTTNDTTAPMTDLLAQVVPASPSPTPPPDSPSATTFHEAVAGTFTVVVTNNCGGTATWTEAGALPSGVTFSGDSATAATTRPTATLAGTPALGTAGGWPIIITIHPTCSAVSQSFTLTVLAAGAYTAVTPVRVLDTRNGTGAPMARLGAGKSVNLTITGALPLAPAGAIAVVLNVTATSTTAGSFLTVFPKGAARPNASNLNWTAGITIANLVEVPVGGGGAITFYNAAGSTHVFADLEGYFSAPSGSAGGQVALAPARITDTRNGSGQPNAGNHLGANSTLAIQVTGVGGVPASGVSGAILNVTVTHTTSTSFLTVWPHGLARPLASNVNWTAGLTIPNRIFVPVSGGMVDIYNAAGSADVIVDVSGYFTDGTATGRFFTPQNPVRILDTRPGAPVGPNATRVLQVGGVAGVPRFATAVVVNVTVTNTSAGGFLTVHPSTTALPVASDLNWTPDKTIPNLVVATLGNTGAISLYNSTGTTDVIVDLVGYFGGAAPALVINKFETQGGGGSSDCFVEIFNPTASPAWFAAWTLVSRTASGTTDTVLGTVPAGTTIPAGGYYLFLGTAIGIPAGSVI
jgi:phosphoesterase family protein